MAGRTCPSCLTPISPHAAECPYCRAPLSPAPVAAPKGTEPAGVKLSAPSEVLYLRRHKDGRAIFVPMGIELTSYVIPEERIPRIIGMQRDLMIWSSLGAGASTLLRPSVAAFALYGAAWISVNVLVRALWLPRGCQKIRVTADDLVPVSRSPAARAQALGKPRLRITLGTFAVLSALTLLLIPLSPLIGTALLVLFGVLAWDAWRCLRTLG